MSTFSQDHILKMLGAIENRGSLENVLAGVDERISEEVRRLSALFGELITQANTDYLTGAYNRRYFFRRVDEVLAQAREYENFRAAMLLYDLDDFKLYNDTYGHAVGDEILCDTAKLIASMCRSQDVVARVGGDEFAVLFWDVRPRRENSRPLIAAVELADRFRQAITTLKPASLGENAQGRLSISGGLACYPQHGEDCDALLRTADEGLLAAKRTGKNTIVICGES